MHSRRGAPPSPGSEHSLAVHGMSALVWACGPGKKITTPANAWPWHTSSLAPLVMHTLWGGWGGGPGVCQHTLSKLDTEMVHAPQPPSPQPSLVPVRPLARSQLSSVVSGPKSLPGLSSYSLLLTKKYSRELAVPAAAGATPAPFIIPACPWRGCCLRSGTRPT